MKKVLLIEDNVDLLETTADILELSNYKVFTAKNGKEGVLKAKKELPDIIICDIMMPVLDGFGVLHMLQRDTATASIPFIFLTAKIERSAVRKGMNMGADDYLTKPFEEIELLDAIESRLHKKNQITETAPQKELLENNDNEAVFIEQLLVDCPLFTYEKKSYVFNEGHIANKLFYIKKGRVKSYKLSHSGKELITNFYTSGDFLGLSCLLGSSDVYNETVEVLEDAVIHSISKDKLSELLSNKDLYPLFTRLLSNNYVELEEKLTQLAYDSVRQRITKTLLDLYTKEKSTNKTIRQIVVTREDLANLIGIAPETLTRGLSELKKDGIIALDKKSIKLLDLEKLKNISISNFL